MTEESLHKTSETSEHEEKQAEYYLETLISDAFKGKGFQKITELFQDKVVCSSQRYSKVLLSQLDRLINKELDRNEYKHVSLLLKCIQHFCKTDHQEGSTLIQQGLISKMVLWFERSLDFLNISGKTDDTISALVEDFYDTALVISKCNCEDGRKQLLDSFLFRLGYVVTEKWPPYHLQLEALRTLNCILDNISREDKKTLNSTEEICVLTQDLARTILVAGDYDIQVAISEALCRIMMKKWRENFANRWFMDSNIAKAFKEIKDKDFETDCRKFLNFLNSKLQDKSGVYTFPCITVFADMDELKKPQDDKLEEFWIDFNVGSQSISFYLNNTEGSLWDSVRLQKNAVNNYCLKEINQQKVCSIYLKQSLTINNKDITKVKIFFRPDLDIEKAIERAFGSEKSMTCSPPLEVKETLKPADEEKVPVSNTVLTTETTYQQWKNNLENSSKNESASDILGSQISEQSSTAKISSESTQKSLTTNESQEISAAISVEEVIIIPEEQTEVSFSPVVQDMTSSLPLSDVIELSDIPTETLKQRAKERSVTSPDGLTEKKKSKDCYEFQYSSDDKVSEAKKKILIQKPFCHRPTEISQQSYSPASPDRGPSSTYKKHLFSESDGVASNHLSEKSWILDFSKKSLTKSADYSRKKPRIKSKLKVLPLSSESSDDQMKIKDSTSKFTSVKKGYIKARGKAKSLSSPELKLPGISALLTPGDSLLKSSNVNLSDYDEQDRMDPLEDESSPGYKRPSNHSEDVPRVHVSGVSREPSRDSTGIFSENSIYQRKRTLPSLDESEIILKPRKLFASSEKNDERTGSLSEDLSSSRKRFSLKKHEQSEEIKLIPRRLFASDEKKEKRTRKDASTRDPEEEVFSESCEIDLDEAGILAAFESFTNDLKKKFMFRYKKMEVRAQNMLKASHLHMSTLLSQIHQCRLHKLNHFHKIVENELSSLETEEKTLKVLEKETLNFWEEQSVKMNSFLSGQKERMKSMDSGFGESISNLADVIQKDPLEQIIQTEESIHDNMTK